MNECPKTLLSETNEGLFVLFFVFYIGNRAEQLFLQSPLEFGSCFVQIHECINYLQWTELPGLINMEHTHVCLDDLQ